jgi:hypothetical protein
MAGIKTYGRAVHSFVSRGGKYELESLRSGGPFRSSITASATSSWAR